MQPASCGQQALFMPQLSVHGPVQPVGVQHVLLEVQMATPEQPHVCWTPHVSGTEILHWLPHWLVGAQHAPPGVHSWPPGHPPVHCTCWPQLFVTVTPPQRPAQALLFGMQQRLL
jgi:hypothetical protein